MTVDDDVTDVVPRNSTVLTSSKDSIGSVLLALQRLYNGPSHSIPYRHGCNQWGEREGEGSPLYWKKKPYKITILGDFRSVVQYVGEYEFAIIVYSEVPN